MPIAAETIALFRKFLYIRESQAIAQNRGLRVEAIQHWSGGVAGDSWCVELAWMVLDISFAGRPPFDRMQSCEAVRAWARAEDRMILALRPGDLYLFINAQDRAHHLGMITEVRPSSSVASDLNIAMIRCKLHREVTRLANVTLLCCDHAAGCKRVPRLVELFADCVATAGDVD